MKRSGDRARSTVDNAGGRRRFGRVVGARRRILRLVLAGITVLLTIVSGLAAIPPAASAAPRESTQPTPAPVPKQHPQPKNMSVLQNGYGPTAQQTAAMRAASATARRSGKAVTVDGLTTETQEIQAQPGGRFELTETPQPVRTPQHGSWVPVDTTLRRNTDGSYSPAATAYGGVIFSGGDNSTLVSTTSGSTTYAVLWTNRLPAPTVSGSTATYPNVLPGVDLALTATVDGGFSDVFVIHDANAAHNPALAHLSLPTKVIGGSVRTQPQGGIQVTSATGGDTLEGSTPLAWDSNITLTSPAAKGTHAAGGSASTPAAADPSNIAHAGLAARIGTVAVSVTSTQLNLTPDPHLLTDARTVFPVYLDPSFGWHPVGANAPDFDEVKQGQPCTNVSLFDNTSSAGDGANGHGNLGAGYNKWSSCIGIQRAYYQWQLPTVIWGARIGNVPGQPGAVVDVLKTYSASCIPSTDYLHWAGGIGTGTNWNNQPRYGPNIGDTSGKPIPNGPNGQLCPNAPQPSAGFDVSGQIQSSADNHSSQFTAVLTGNESSGSNEFSRFYDNPSLQIYYDLPPNTPGPDWAASGSDNVGCATGNTGPYPYLGKTIMTNPPILNATVSDPDGDHLQATFSYWVGSSSPQTGLSADNLGSGTTAQYTLPPSFVSGLADGQVVSWQASVTDGLLTNRDPGPICHFTAEPTSPSAPTMTSADGVYPANGKVGAVYGTPGQFTLAATSGNVTKLVQQLDQPPATNNPPASDVVPFNGGAAISPAGRWKLSDNTGTSAADSSGNNHAATLYGGASWTSDPTRGPVLNLNGSTGYAATTGPVINTEGSFTVAAWVNIATAGSNWQTAVSQQATTNSGFDLQRDPRNGDWSFSEDESDTPGPNADYAESNTSSPLNTWTYLVGTYDAGSGAMTLYINGTESGSATNAHPVAAKGPLTIGRAFYNATPVDFVNGSISDVQLYQYPLSASDVTNLYHGATIAPAGRWKFSEGTGATAADSSGNNHPATLTGGYTWAPGSPAGVTFNGSTGYAATAGPVLNTLSNYSVAAWVNVAAAGSNWQTFVSQQATTNVGFDLQRDPSNGNWSFSQDESDTPGPNGDYAESQTPSALNTWVYLVGTYDAGSGAMTLYVNGAASGSATNTHPVAAKGPLTIGRAFYNATPVDFVNGSVSDVQTYQSVLDASEIAQLYESSTFPVTPLSPGPHTLYGYAADAAGDPSGYQSDSFVAAGDPNRSCASLAACYDNTGISPDNNPGLANFDGDGNSFSATDLTDAGWTSGGHIAIDGGTFTLPTYGSGHPDNILAANQTIAGTTDPALSSYNQTATTVSGGSALQFLTTATYAITASPGAINGDDTAPYVSAGQAVAGTYCFDSTNPAAYCAPHGTITYSDGTTQPYYLTVPDWVSGPYGIDVMAMPHENWSSGSQNTTNDPKVYDFAVPLKAGAKITSVTLPDVGEQAGPTTTALHIFSMTTRNTTSGAPNQQTWTGSWAAANEADFTGNAPGGGYSDETFRIPARPSLSGNTVRIKLDDALGNSPLQISHATIAAQANSGSPIPTAVPVSLTFSGQQAVTIPQGGMVYSDAVTFPITANQPILVSFALQNSTPTVPARSWPTGGGGEWVSPGGSGDHTTDTTDTAFTEAGSAASELTSVLTGLEVATAHTATQAVVGDGFIDTPELASTYPPASTNLADDLTATEATTPTPYGSVAEGIETNEVMTSFPMPDSGGGPSLLARIDRDILDQPNITTVVLDEGLEDILSGRQAADLDANGYTELIQYLQAAGITTIVLGATPCDGYAGDGLSPNDTCTATVDTQRTAVNNFLSGNPSRLNQWSPVPLFYLNSDAAIGAPDASNGETKLNPAADNGDHVNLTNAGFGALANSYLDAQDTWPLADGAANTTATLATDAASNATNPYLINNPLTGNNPLTLAGSITWPTDPNRGTVLGLDGSTAYGAAPGPVLTTTGSYSVSAWANLSATTRDADIISQDGTQNSGFALQYDHADDKWAFTMPTADTANASYIRALSGAAPQTGIWTHVVGTYNAVTHTLSLYVNGALAGTATNTTPTNATGALTVGRGQTNASPTAYFPGELSTVQTWNYALAPTQVTALDQQVN